MSFFVHSDDYDSGGTSSDGVWSFGRSVKGNWSVIGQHMDNQTFPWMWDGTNFMVMRMHDPMEELAYVTFEITFDPAIGLLSDTTEIANQLMAEMQATIDTVASDPETTYAARTITNSVDNDAHTITFHFESDDVDILWQGGGMDPVYASTVNVPFGRTADTPDETHIQDLVISTHNMDTAPKYVEVYIAESNTQFSTSHSTRPTLFFSTRDGEFLGQTFSIPTDTHSLTLQIKRMSDSEIVPLTGTWYLIFQSAS